MTRHEEARSIVISAIARTMDIYGITPSVGRIFGVLYFSDTPLSLDEIKDEVGMSKGSVSTGLRELLNTEMITKVWLKGERRDYYIAEKNFFKNFLSFFTANLRKERSITLNAIDQVRPTLDELSSQKDEAVGKPARRDIDLLNETEVYYEWLDRLIRSMETGEIFEKFPVPEHPVRRERKNNE